MDERTDEDIADAVQHGDTEAFGELVSRYETKLMRYGRRFLFEREDVEDFVQDAFIKAYQNIQSFDTSLRFSPWMYRIAHNTFVNGLRGKRAISQVFDADVLLPCIPAKETTDGTVLQEELRAELDELIKALPIKYREVIILHYFEELSYKEISDVLHIPVTTVGVRILRARKKLEAAYTTQNV